jgi:hypothetical protein
MIQIGGAVTKCCEGRSRREWLRIGGLSALGLGLPDLLRTRALQAASPHGSPITPVPARAKSCIVLFLFGAPAHQDTWDMKPDAPSELRGEFKPISSSVPGTMLGEHMPRLASMADRYAIVRSMSHPDNIHTVAMHYMLTGTRHAAPSTNPRNSPADFPTFGAVMNYLHANRGPRVLNSTDDGGLPRGISLNAPANQVSAGNHIFPGFFAGFLGSAYDPLFVSQDASAPDFQAIPACDEPSRLGDRRTLLGEVDRQADQLARVADVRSVDRFYERAFSILTAAATRQACDLTRESPQLRDRYGMNSFGQGCLLARRLVEAGVPLITVNWARDDAFWDTHKDNFKDLKSKLLPPFDLGFSALLEDLAQRGLLDETLVVCLAEFGRTPKINSAAGRDHWAPCFSVVLAGAGVRGGLVYGASDRIAAYPTDSPVSPADLAATIYSSLGVDPSMEIRDRTGRPYTLAAGRPIGQLF